MDELKNLVRPNTSTASGLAMMPTERRTKIDLYDTMTIGKAWNDLSWAQQDQAEALIGQYGYDIDAAVEAGELNPNALYDIVRFFELAASYGCDDAEQFAGEIRTYLSEMEKARSAC